MQSSNAIYKQTNSQNILYSDTGASLDDSLKRYKLYERKLGENLNSVAFEAALKHFTITNPPSHHNTNNNNNNHTDNSRTADSDTDDNVSSKPPKSVSNKQTTSNNNSLNNNGKNDVYILDGSKKNPYNVYNSIDRKSLPQPEYDLNTIIKSLDDNYYMSRTQVRYAFTLYLSKIQLRLVIESEVKDESNTQQMVYLEK